jgi:hypothetical protein
MAHDQRATDAKPPAPNGVGAVEEVEVQGHIVDSLLLPKILDRILQMNPNERVVRDTRVPHRRPPG